MSARQRGKHKKGPLMGTLVLLLVALLWGGVQRANAHAEMAEAVPAPGTIFRWNRPTEVRLRFTQRLDAATILVTDRRFAPVHAGEAQVDGDDPRVASVALGSLTPATYTVTWRTSSVDGHHLDGAYEFTVLPREPIITMVVAAVVLSLLGLLLFVRRERPDEA